MSHDLVTVATFWSPVEANLARGQLEAAGIRAFLLGEETVGTAWHLTNSMGGMRLQVSELDAERAISVLNEIEGLGDELPEGWEDAAAEAEPPEPIPDEPEEPTSVQPAAQTGPATERARTAHRAMRGAVTGLLFFPFQFYVFYLLIKVFLSDEELGSNGRWHAWIAFAINLPVILASLVTTGFIAEEVCYGPVTY